MNRSGFASRILTVLTVCAAAAGTTACGVHQEEEAGGIIRTETEGIYLKLDKLKYQVQISRQLNPTDITDRAYLTGIPAAERGLGNEELWFGVFLRVQNDTDEPHPVSTDIKIIDTQEKVYEPIALGPENPFRYAPPSQLEPKTVIPKQDTIASETPTQGALLLFKVTNDSLDNRPLELEIKGRTVPQKTGIIDLDV